MTIWVRIMRGNDVLNERPIISPGPGDIGAAVSEMMTELRNANPTIEYFGITIKLDSE